MNEKTYFIDVTAVLPGTCALCYSKCTEGAILHYECAKVYSQGKEEHQRLKQIEDDRIKSERKSRLLK